MLLWLFGSDTFDTFGLLAIMPLLMDDASRMWNLVEMVHIAGRCKLQGFEVEIHSSPVKKLVYVGLNGTQLEVPDGRILNARSHLTVYNSRACRVAMEPDQECRVGEMLRKVRRRRGGCADSLWRHASPNSSERARQVQVC